MINLTRGNLNNLEGKVLVFSRCESNEKESEILAVYVATNPLDFVDKMGMPREMAGKLEQQFKQTAEEIKEKISGLDGAEQLKKELDKAILPAYVGQIPIPSEVDLYLGDEDVLDVGNFSNRDNCMDMIKAGIRMYLLKHNDNLERKHDLKNEKIRSNREKEIRDPTNNTPEITYREVGKTEFRQYLLNNFITPLLDSHRYGELQRVRAVGASFINFGADSPFAANIIDFVDAINKGKDKPNLPLIESYLEMVVAVRNEDYKTAAMMRDKIREMNK